MDSLRLRDLLPKSGVGVVEPWLVIATPGDAVIRIDLRLLDGIEFRPRKQEPSELSELLLVCGDREVAVHIADGPEAAARVVAEAAQWTRKHSTIRLPRVASAAARASRPASYAKLVVVSSTPDAEIRLDDALAGYTYDLSEPVMLVGRTAENDIIIDHRSISREHAKVTRDTQGRYTITDLHASNGLRVNGERCIAVELTGGEIVDMGHVRMQFVAPGDVIDYNWAAPMPPDPDRFLIVGDEAVIRRDEHIQIGSVAFTIGEVEQYALRDANLPLMNCRLFRAALALLVVPATDRDRHDRS